MKITSRLPSDDLAYQRYKEGVKETAQLVLNTVENLRTAALNTMGTENGKSVLVALEVIEHVLMTHHFKDQ